MKQFVPFYELEKQNAYVIVDALHPIHLTLSHWKGANIHPEIAADTSGEIVLNAIKRNFPGWDADRISANHFDIDGFVGVFALLNPELALEYESVLREMALIGDFRHYAPNRAGSELALKLCCWMNELEKKLFYKPFGNRDEIHACVEKFEYFLKQFPDVLCNPDEYKTDWEPAYLEVKKGLDQLIEKKAFPEIGMLAVSAKEAIPYYALFSESDAFDLIFSSYPGNRYELEYKYTTWVDIASRPSFPRLNLKPLAAKLNQMERSEYSWMVDGITDTGPILRLERNKISKASRFSNPNEREIYPSSISPEEMSSTLINYLKRNMPSNSPAYFWTWKNLKKINCT